MLPRWPRMAMNKNFPCSSRRKGSLGFLASPYAPYGDSAHPANFRTHRAEQSLSDACDANPPRRQAPYSWLPPFDKLLESEVLRRSHVVWQGAPRFLEELQWPISKNS
jgi:hypothetical protein